MLKNITDKIIAFSATIECIVLLVLAVFIALYFIGCAGPRSATMCYDEAKLKYVKCYDGYKPGDIIPADHKRTRTR